MAIKAWSAFYPDVMLNANGCPQPVADHFLRLAAIDICSQSKRLKVDLAAFDTVAGDAVYPINSGSGLSPVVVLGGTADGVPITPLLSGDVAGITDWQLVEGTPTRFLAELDDKTIRLWRVPDGAYTVALKIAAKPSETATGIEEWFADRYRNGIVSGALAKLLALPGKSWSNPGLVAYHDEQFKSAVSTASAEYAKDGTRAPLRTKPYGRA